MRNLGYAAPEHSGWYLAAFTDEFSAGVYPLVIGRKQLMIVSAEDQPASVYDATCPHRGASLAHGGAPVGAHVICPFHGKAISLGLQEDSHYCVQGYPSFVVGGTLFVCLDPDKGDDRGFEDIMRGLATTHTFVAGGSRWIRVAQEAVIENAFDLDHFSKVHRISRVLRRGFGHTESGAAFCEANFLVATPPWERSAQPVVNSRFYARAFSPSVVLTELGPVETSHVAITGATADGEHSHVRILYGLRKPPEGAAPTDGLASALVAGGQKALDDDAAVWEHLDPDMTPSFDGREDAVRMFRDFCTTFPAMPCRSAPAGGDV